MKKEILDKFILERKSISQISTALHIPRSSLRYWLKKYQLKTDYKLPSHKCYKCGETDPTKFYGNKKRICGKCHNKENIRRTKENKKKIIDYLGGKCANPECGGWKYNYSFDVHHLDPTLKDPNFKTMKGWKWERIVEELKKCILLCKNCHCALHNGEWNL